MTLQVELSQQLWKTVNENYDKGNFTAAILDSIFLLGNVLRDRSGSQNDGVALVGEALGGTDPVLKLTPLRTDSEKNVQKGTESALRGIFQAIRNPRSHDKMVDTKETAEKIFIIVDYFLQMMNTAKAPFEIGDLVKRVLDKEFVESEEYADLLVAEIPSQKLYDSLTSLYAAKNIVAPHSIRLVIRSILNRLQEEEKASFIKLVADELKLTDDEATFRVVTAVFAGEEWTKLPKICRLRVENKLIKSVKDGEYKASTGKCIRGALGSWLSNIIENMDIWEQANYTLMKKLGSANRNEQDYVFNYFAGHLIQYGKKPNDSLLRLMKEGLTKGDKRYYDMLSTEVYFSDEDWAKELHPLIEAFQEKKLEEDDRPF